MAISNSFDRGSALVKAFDDSLRAAVVRLSTRSSAARVRHSERCRTRFLLFCAGLGAAAALVGRTSGRQQLTAADAGERPGLLGGRGKVTDVRGVADRVERPVYGSRVRHAVAHPVECPLQTCVVAGHPAPSPAAASMTSWRAHRAKRARSVRATGWCRERRSSSFCPARNVASRAASASRAPDRGAEGSKVARHLVGQRLQRPGGPGGGPGGVDRTGRCRGAAPVARGHGVRGIPDRRGQGVQCGRHGRRRCVGGQREGDRLQVAVRVAGGFANVEAQNLPLLRAWSGVGMGSMLSQCSTIIPFSRRNRSNTANSWPSKSTRE